MLSIPAGSQKHNVRTAQTSQKRQTASIRNRSLVQRCDIYYNTGDIGYMEEVRMGMETGDFGIREMLGMQQALQEKYKDIWKPICPDRGQDQLLWMIGEIGEVVDIIKKHGGGSACRDDKLRQQLIEELTDVLMYYNDVLLCYGITAEELKKAYIAKFERNMQRW